MIDNKAVKYRQTFVHASRIAEFLNAYVESIEKVISVSMYDYSEALIVYVGKLIIFDEDDNYSEPAEDEDDDDEDDW